MADAQLRAGQVHKGGQAGSVLRANMQAKSKQCASGSTGQLCRQARKERIQRLPNFFVHTHTHTPRSWQTLATWQLSCWPGRRGSPDTGPASRALQHSEAWEGREKQAVTCFY